MNLVAASIYWVIVALWVTVLNHRFGLVVQESSGVWNNAVAIMRSGY
jgi:hypothetical protein